MDTDSADLAPDPRPVDAAAPGGEPHGGELRGGAIGLRAALGVTVANMAPVNGVFLTAPAIVAAMGTRAPWAFLLVTVGLLAAAATVAEFARRIVSPGSLVAYSYYAYRTVTPGLGTRVSAALFYTMLLAGPLTLGAVSVFAGHWSATALGLAGDWWLVLSLAALVFAAAVVLRGIVASSRLAMALAAVQLAVLFAFAVLLLVRSGGDITVPLHSDGGEPGGLAGLSGLTFPLAVAGMVGWDNSAGMAAELRRPRRVVPLTVISAVALVGLLYTLCTWAGLAGYAHWQGAARGADRFGAPANGAPFLELAQHYLPVAHGVLAAVGAISSVACLVGAMTAMSRITFTAARAGMLPRRLGYASTRHGVPIGAVLLWFTLIALCTALPALTGAAPTTASSWEAGMGTVPLLLNLLVVLIGLPLYIRRTEPGSLRLVRHLLVPFTGLAVIGWGVYGNVRPDQPAPGNTFWICTAVIAVLAVTAAVRFARSPAPGLSALGVEPETPPAG
ncbi:APC family permease [Streptomyces sp. NBC_01089]|uniref:APC family permease n=1 Tax=Streptomyces sp. NBC_01089 TaxID=2903747 RepID=UPI0038656E91|nr:APC family permease [Streptomyces sp. NBC_01089]